MSKVRYIGPFAAVDVVLPSGAYAHVEHGDVFETTEDHAAALLEQTTNWEAPNTTAKKKGGDE